MFAASRSDAAPRRDPVAVLLLFAGIALVLAAFSPWSVRGAGYTGEDLRAIADALRALRGALGLGPAFSPAQYPRHGAASLAGHLPFVLLSRLLFGSDPAAEDRIVSLEPVLATALIGAIVYAWLRRTGAGAGRARAVALLAVFGTLLWPYAFIGLETTQSAALVVAGFLALGGAPRTAFRTIVFAAAAALALSAKATSVFLLPAVAYLGFEYFRRDEARDRKRATALSAAAVVLFVAAAFAVNAWTRTFWWAQLGGTRHVIGKWLVRDPFVFLAHLVSLFGSANKGLFFYAPVLAAAALAGPRAWRRDRRVVVFAVLTALGLAAGFSLVRNWWSDETWGPRYLHSAVAPIALLLGIAWPEGAAVPRAWRSAVAALAALGLAVSFLGVFFYYGLVQRAATSASQSTLEALQGDPVWNAVVFDGRLFRAWVRGAGKPGAPPAIWVPAHYWWYATPASFRGWPGVDLGRLAHPQPLLFRRDDELGPGDRPLRALSFAALAAGIFLLAAEAVRSRRPAGVDARRIGPDALAILFAAVLAGSWARSWEETLRGRFYLGAAMVRDSTAFRTVLAAAERAVPGGGTLVGVGRLPDWNATHWSRWLYPRRVIWIGPGAPRQPGIREARGARYALVLGGAPESGVRLGRVVAEGGGVELRELEP